MGSKKCIVSLRDKQCLKEGEEERNYIIGGEARKERHADGRYGFYWGLAFHLNGAAYC